MIINIISSPKTSYRKLLMKTNLYNGMPKYQRKKTLFMSPDNNYSILVNRHGVVISFQSDDDTTIETLKQYVSFVFNDTYIGVDKDSPVTSHLENIQVFSI